VRYEPLRDHSTSLPLDSRPERSHYVQLKDGL
jgi:hypothetical protein